MDQSNFEQWAAVVNNLGFDGGHVDFVPRYVFASYVAGFSAGLTPEQSQRLMSARAFVSVATAPLSGNKISLSRANDFLNEWDLRTEVKEAISKLLPDEVQEKYLYLFDSKPDS